jgi:sugar/nucleoside kinase (ribokinase family)
VGITIVGNTVVDIVFPELKRMPGWPSHSEFTSENLVFPRRPPIVTLGGNGANAAFVAARCGAAVTLHSPTGRDVLGSIARRWLREAGCRMAPARGGATALNVTATNRRDQRATLFYPGAPVGVPRISTGRAAPTHLLVCGWPHPPLRSVAAAFGRCRRRRIFTAIDAGPILGRPWTLAALRGVLAELDLFLANEHEIRGIARRRGLDAALGRLRRHYSGHVVIKRGAKGALWLPAGSSRPLRLPPRRVRVISTVGAGDTFNGALLAMLSRGEGWLPALRAANATAATVVSSPRGLLGARLRRG